MTADPQQQHQQLECVACSSPCSMFVPTLAVTTLPACPHLSPCVPPRFHVNFTSHTSRRGASYVLYTPGYVYYIYPIASIFFTLLLQLLPFVNSDMGSNPNSIFKLHFFCSYQNYGRSAIGAERPPPIPSHLMMVATTTCSINERCRAKAIDGVHHSVR